MDSVEIAIDRDLKILLISAIRCTEAVRLAFKRAGTHEFYVRQHTVFLHRKGKNIPISANIRI